MSELPTIYPLSEEPLGRGPNGECLCNWCRHWSPLLKHIESQLDDAGKALLNEYVSHIEQEVEDGDVDRARLNGEWPGWESLKGFSPWTHKVVEMTETEKEMAQKEMDS